MNNVDSVLTAVLWIVMIGALIALFITMGLKFAATRRTDTNLGRDDIEAVCARRKGVGR